MKLKSNIHAGLAKKPLSIMLILAFCIFLFVTNAIAGGCYVDEICFNCGQMNHHPATGHKTGFMPNGCQPGTSNSACGITTSRLFKHQNFLLSVIRVDNHEGVSIPAGPPIDFSKDLFSRSSISPLYPSVVADAPPIYLLNLSLLC
jgi:hypothetical protein